MIQRIQSLYLVLTILLSFLFLGGGNLNFADNSGAVLKVKFTGIFSEGGGAGVELVERTLPLTAVIILIPVLSVITIMLYRNRKTQSLFAVTGIVLSAVLILLSAYYVYIISINFNTHLVPGFKMLIPLFLLVFNFLAYRGIRQDDRIIKSYERLR